MVYSNNFISLKTDSGDQDINGLNGSKETFEIKQMPAIMTGYYELFGLNNRHADRHTDRHTDRQTDRQTHTQTHGHTDTQTDRQTDRLTD